MYRWFQSWGSKTPPKTTEPGKPDALVIVPGTGDLPGSDTYGEIAENARQMGIKVVDNVPGIGALTREDQELNTFDYGDEIIRAPKSIVFSKLWSQMTGRGKFGVDFVAREIDEQVGDLDLPSGAKIAFVTHSRGFLPSIKWLHDQQDSQPRVRMMFHDPVPGPFIVTPTLTTANLDMPLVYVESTATMTPGFANSTPESLGFSNPSRPFMLFPFFLRHSAAIHPKSDGEMEAKDLVVNVADSFLKGDVEQLQLMEIANMKRFYETMRELSAREESLREMPGEDFDGHPTTIGDIVGSNPPPMTARSGRLRKFQDEANEDKEDKNEGPPTLRN